MFLPTFYRFLKNQGLASCKLLFIPIKVCLVKAMVVCLVKSMVFPVVMYGCASETTKAAEYQRIDAFELWFWRRLLKVPWTARRSNQSILKEINPEYSLEGLMLKLKLQYFGHLMWKTDSLENKGTAEDAMVGWHHWLDGHEFEQAPGVGDGQGSLACCSPPDHKELDRTGATGMDWTKKLLFRDYNWEKETKFQSDSRGSASPIV